MSKANCRFAVNTSLPGSASERRELAPPDRVNNMQREGECMNVFTLLVRGFDEAVGRGLQVHVITFTNL